MLFRWYKNFFFQKWPLQKRNRSGEKTTPQAETFRHFVQKMEQLVLKSKIKIHEILILFPKKKAEVFLELFSNK